MVDMSKSQDNTARQKRQTAFKVNISSILNNNYYKEEGWLPNYIDMGGIKVSRVNIIGVIVSVNMQDDKVDSLIFDDGSSNIPLRFFDYVYPGIAAGDIVNIIGRPREFGGEKYISPEIIKKVDNTKWVKLRKSEIDDNIIQNSNSKNNSDGKFDNVSENTNNNSDNIIDSEEIVTDLKSEPIKSVSEEKIDNIKSEKVIENPLERMISIIRNMDSGSGVSHDEIQEEYKLSDLDTNLLRLLEEGDIFEIKPGRYKVLE